MPRWLILSPFLLTLACSSGTTPAPPAMEPTKPAPVPTVGPEPAERPTKPAPKTRWTPKEQALAAAGLEAVAPGPGLRVALVYATAKNFTGQVLYTDLHHCFLRPEAARKLRAAAAALQARHPDRSLLVADCARPLSIQRLLWRLHPNPAHVANPEAGASAHNHGCAVDLTLASDAGALEMGTGLDEFSAGARLTVTAEPALCREGLLHPTACANRRLLREVMTASGFEPYAGEWWHFSGCDRDRFEVIP